MKTEFKKGGTNPIDTWRPRPLDVAALEVLMEKLRLDKTNVLRLSLHRLVDFEGVAQQVAERASQYV